jgi:hypothetical protein
LIAPCDCTWRLPIYILWQVELFLDALGLSAEELLVGNVVWLSLGLALVALLHLAALAVARRAAAAAAAARRACSAAWRLVGAGRAARVYDVGDGDEVERAAPWRPPDALVFPRVEVLPRDDMSHQDLLSCTGFIPDKKNFQPPKLMVYE